MTERKSGRRPGRPEYKPTEGDRGRVEAWTSVGLQEKAIARRLGISHMTVRKHYPEELRLGRDLKYADLTERAYDLAMGKHGATAADQERMIMFILKCQYRWNDSPGEISVAPGSDSDASFTITIGRKCDEKRNG